jgi:hypothetical protein
MHYCNSTGMSGRSGLKPWSVTTDMPQLWLNPWAPGARLYLSASSETDPVSTPEF